MRRCEEMEGEARRGDARRDWLPRYCEASIFNSPFPQLLLFQTKTKEVRTYALGYMKIGLENEDTTPYRSDDLNRCLEVHDDGTITVKPELGKAVFYNEHDEQDFGWAAKQLRPQSLKPFEGKSELAWQTKPSTYVVCRYDNALPVAGQRKMAARATQSIEWDTDHSPFVYRPELVATLLVGLSVSS